MIESEYLISIIYLLYYGLLGMTIIAIALIIALAIILSKSKLKGMSPVQYRIHSLQVA